MSLDPEAVAAALQSATPEARLKALQKALIDNSDAMLIRYVQLAAAAIAEGNVDIYMRYLAQAEGLLHAIDNAADAARGAKQFEAASRGGANNRGRVAVTSNPIIECMKDAYDRHPRKGITWAAQRAYLKGLGSSVDANRKLWYRYR